MSMIKHVIILIFVFFNLNLIGQNRFHSIFIKGIVTIENSPLTGVKINILSDGNKEKTVENENNGEYNFTLEPAKEYIIEFTKTDYVSKRVYISTKEVTKDEIKFGMFPLSIDIQLFEDFEGLNTEILKKPVAKWTFTDYEGDFVNDAPYSLLMKNEADKVKASMLQLKKQAYEKLINTANNSFKEKELENAWLDYDNSLKISPK